MNIPHFVCFIPFPAPIDLQKQFHMPGFAWLFAAGFAILALMFTVCLVWSVRREDDMQFVVPNAAPSGSSGAAYTTLTDARQDD